MGAFGRESPGVDRDGVRIEAVSNLPADWRWLARQNGGKRPPLVHGVVRIGDTSRCKRRCRKLDTCRSFRGQPSFTPPIAEIAHRPFENIPGASAPGEAESRQLVEGRNLGKIHVRKRRGELCQRRRAGPAVDRKLVFRIASVKTGAGVGDLEPAARPVQRAIKGREAIRVQPRELAGERPVEVVPALEQVKHAGEIRRAAQVPWLLREEDLAHP